LLNRKALEERLNFLSKKNKNGQLLSKELIKEFLDLKAKLKNGVSLGIKKRLPTP
jgi:hypothetical protein